MTASKKDAAMYEMKMSPLRKLKERLDSSKDQEMHFVKLEKEAVDGLTSIALALFDVHGPATKEFPQKDEHALVVLKGTTEGGNGYEWWVEDVTYPYKPRPPACRRSPWTTATGTATDRGPRLRSRRSASPRLPGGGGSRRGT